MHYPLMDLYLTLDFSQDPQLYKTVVTDFNDLWGADIHLLGADFFNCPWLEDFLEHASNFNFNTYSINHRLKDRELGASAIKNIDIPLMERCKVNALVFPISAELVKRTDYVALVDRLLCSSVIPEPYWQVDLDNSADLDLLVGFCINQRIKQMIVQIETNDQIVSAPIRNIAYYNFLSRVYSVNAEQRERCFRVSVADCPYHCLMRDNVNTSTMGGCSAAFTSCAVDEKGNFVPCLDLSPIVLGNIFSDSLKDVWTNSRVLAKLRNRENLAGKCGSCSFRLCCGGCRAEALRASGDLFAGDANCWIE